MNLSQHTLFGLILFPMMISKKALAPATLRSQSDKSEQYINPLPTPLPPPSPTHPVPPAPHTPHLPNFSPHFHICAPSTTSIITRVGGCQSLPFAWKKVKHKYMNKILSMTRLNRLVSSASSAVIIKVVMTCHIRLPDDAFRVRQMTFVNFSVVGDF